MISFESYLSHELPTHILVVHMRVCVTDALEVIMEHLPYLVPKDPPLNALVVPLFVGIELVALGLATPSLNLLNLTLTNDDD